MLEIIKQYLEKPILYEASSENLRKDARLKLLKLIFRALKKNGILIFDVFTPKMRKTESQSWHYTEVSDFWREKEHLCLSSVFFYDDEDQTELRRSVVITEEKISCFNIRDHFFTKEKLAAEIAEAGFLSMQFYDDIAEKAVFGRRFIGDLMRCADKIKAKYVF